MMLLRFSAVYEVSGRDAKFGRCTSITVTIGYSAWRLFESHTRVCFPRMLLPTQSCPLPREGREHVHWHSRPLRTVRTAFRFKHCCHVFNGSWEVVQHYVLQSCFCGGSTGIWSVQAICDLLKRYITDLKFLVKQFTQLNLIIVVLCMSLTSVTGLGNQPYLGIHIYLHAEHIHVQICGHLQARQGLNACLPQGVSVFLLQVLSRSACVDRSFES